MAVKIYTTPTLLAQVRETGVEFDIRYICSQLPPSFFQVPIRPPVCTIVPSLPLLLSRLP